MKWDGAPAIFCGEDPRDGEFFVAKGIFTEDLKVYKTNAEVDEDMSGDLADKMKTALRLLPSLGIQRCHSRRNCERRSKEKEN